MPKATLPRISLSWRKSLTLFSVSLAAAAPFGLGLPDIPPTITGASPRPFGTAAVTPDFFLNGAGENIDSPEFFEGATPEETLLLVAAKKNDTIEVWRFPFKDHEEAPLVRDSRPNGLALDQETKTLIIGDSERKEAALLSLPDLSPLGNIGNGIIGSGETNGDVLSLPDGQQQLYMTDTRKVHAFGLESGQHLFTFAPGLGSLEELLADSFHQILYITDDQGGSSERQPGGALLAFHPDGTPYEKEGQSRLGEGLFSGDGEGMALYRCLSSAGEDTGQGFLMATDQHSQENGFEFFDRVTWEHLGTLRLEGVSMTDGIDVSERPLPGYPAGIFAAVDSDQSVAIVSWEKISKATGLACKR